MATEHTIEWTADLGDEEVDCLIRYSYSPGSPRYIPPYDRPELYDEGSPAEILIDEVVRLDNGDIITLPTDEHQKAIVWIDEQHLDDEPDTCGGDWRNEWER